MTFAGINYLDVIVAAVVAWIAGAAWYGALGKPWMAALGKTPEQCKAEMEAKKGTPAFYAPFILSFVAELIMAWIMAGLLGHIGGLTVREGVISAAFVWFGFVLTTLSVNNAYAGRKPMLTIIDGFHWLLVLVVIGAIIGGWGV
jgi:hypothetical protein